MKYHFHTVRLVAGAFVALACLLAAPFNEARAQTVIWDFEDGNEGFTFRSEMPATPATGDPLTAGDESLTGVGGPNGLPGAGLAWTIGGPATYNGLKSAVPEGGNMTGENLLNYTGGAIPIELNSRGQSNYLNTYNLNAYGDNLHTAANDQIAKSPNVVLPTNAVLIMWTFGGGSASTQPALEGTGYTDGSGGVAVRSAADDSLLASMRTLAQGTLTPFALNLSAFAGQNVYVEVVDAFVGSWGWMAVDEVRITTSEGGFDAANYTFEAEDFNFDSGMFFDNPVVCNTPGVTTPNCYFDRVGTQGVDKLELDEQVTAPDDLSIYRWGPVGSRVELMDTKISSDLLTRTQYVSAGVSDYELRLGASEWVNYTRTFPAGKYHLYARVPANAGSIPVRVDIVDNASVSNQNLTAAGYFVLQGSGVGGGIYEMVRMTDYSGATPAVLSFDGTPKTLRLTALANRYVANFYMLEATTDAPTQMPQVTITAPAAGALVTNQTTITATATSSGGAITNVQFYVRDVLIGEDNVGPDYSMVFTPTGAEGDLNIRVVAINDAGLAGADGITVQFTDPAFVRVRPVADAQVHENGAGTATSGGSNGTAMNARWNGLGNADRNELFVLRFDLTGHTLADVDTATLTVTQFRNQSGQRLSLYGLHPDAAPTEGSFTVNDWDEASVTFATMPGLIFDANSATPGLDTDKATFLGEIRFQSNVKGVLETWSDPAITDFLRAYQGGNMVTFLVANAEGHSSNGQSRVASKEASSLDAGEPSGEPGDFAPILRFRSADLPEDIRITNVSRSGDQLMLQWSGGTGPFSIQKKTLITDAWSNEQTGIPGTSATVTISRDGGASGFYRVVGQ